MAGTAQPVHSRAAGTMTTAHIAQIIDSDLGSVRQLRKRAPITDCLTPSQDEFVLIESGAILLYAIGHSGERIYLSIIAAGHIFTPEKMRVLTASGQFGVEAMQDTLVRRIPRNQWQVLAKGFPDLYQWVIERENQQLNIVQFHLAQQIQRNSLERTRFALCAYAQSLGSVNPCGSKTIRVSRSELADWTGVSSDRMSRLIRSLHNTGEVTLIGRSIVVSPGLLSSAYPSFAR